MKETINKKRVIDLENADVKDLLKYYKHIYKCLRCQKYYGCDKPDRIEACPVCCLSVELKRKPSEEEVINRFG